jgi:hypothetical protein
MEYTIRKLEEESREVYDQILYQQVVVENIASNLASERDRLETLRSRLRDLKDGLDCLKAIQKATQEG